METENVQTDSGIKPLVTYEEVMKLDIRMCKIENASKIEGADKLYLLQINTGIDGRIVVSGIAEHFTLEQLIGKTMPFVLNMAPKKIRGHMSHGMIVLAEGQDKKYYKFSDEETPIGAIVF